VKRRLVSSILFSDEKCASLQPGKAFLLTPRLLSHCLNQDSSDYRMEPGAIL
jgi:protein involved in polysaccharide export with SLBB domain